ncbi:hypothetical protein CA13_32250 [Planctomycetes bacterium CA13]|uniref:Uncharacterized protein n=1 Tax=Novipirellula herctigrandis TaxID=2527986 RepID=A0A5C5Z312_9BACT|nr:hypothetical protein CA13_32250 [Planctomycetes bacterium CA13]
MATPAAVDWATELGGNPSIHGQGGRGAALKGIDGGPSSGFPRNKRR